MTVIDLPHPVPDEVFASIVALEPERGIRIGGDRLPAVLHGTFDVTDPVTDGLIGVLADGTAADATAAVDAAAAAAAGWAGTPPRRRSEMLHRAFEIMTAEAGPLAQLISLENGKPLADARAEVCYAAEFFRWFAEEAVRAEGYYGAAPAGGTRTIVTNRPVGIAALVTPWNFPAAMVTRKIGPALAAGCTVVLKPAAETPLTALAVARILGQAGTPAGAVNVVPTSNAPEVVTTWLTDPRVRKISFTGSTAVGRTLLAHAAGRVVNSGMELGGNAPFVVAGDADVAAAVAGALVAKFRNGGQACTAANRFYVHADVADEFITRFGHAIESLVVGSPFADGTDIGPLISGKAVTGLHALVTGAVAAGAKVSHRSRMPAAGAGHFYPPTLLVDVPAAAAILRTEVFGPVAPVVTWTDEHDLLRQVNDTEFGLAAYVYSRDLTWALTFAERVEAGMVGVNRGVVSDPSAPFGGVKQSGIGREGAGDGVREFRETQYFSLDWTS